MKVSCMANPQSGTLAFLFALFTALHLVATCYYVQRAHTDGVIIMTVFLKIKFSRMLFSGIQHHMFGYLYRPR